MGTIKTTNIETITGSGTLTLGQSGETISVPSGATLDLSNATQTGVGGTMTPAFEAKLGSNQSITHDTTTKLSFDTEIYDTNGNFDAATNYRFTPTVAGKYFAYAKGTLSTNIAELNRYTLYIYKNGSSYFPASNYFTNNPARINHIFSGSTIDMNGSSDYLEVYVKCEYVTSGNPLTIGASSTAFGAYKIIE